MDWHDVRVVQTCSGLGFVAEALQVPRIHGGGEWQHFQSDVAVERNLFGFVDDAHAAAADFADNAEVAEVGAFWAFEVRRRFRRTEHRQGREHSAKLVGNLGVTSGTIIDRWPAPEPEPVAYQPPPWGWPQQPQPMPDDEPAWPSGNSDGGEVIVAGSPPSAPPQVYLPEVMPPEEYEGDMPVMAGLGAAPAAAGLPLVTLAALGLGAWWFLRSPAARGR